MLTWPNAWVLSKYETKQSIFSHWTDNRYSHLSLWVLLKLDFDLNQYHILVSEHWPFCPYQVLVSRLIHPSTSHLLDFEIITTHEHQLFIHNWLTCRNASYMKVNMINMILCNSQTCIEVIIVRVYCECFHLTKMLSGSITIIHCTVRS